MHEKLFNPDYLLSLCQNYDLRPSKKYGQNFLFDFEAIDQIIASAELTKTDTVVEIGPGFGVLSFALAAKVKKLISFEIERKLQGYWQRNKPENMEIIWGNALTAIAGEPMEKIKKYKVVANLPYQITSNIIRKFLEADNPPEMMVLMVQKEVAERICAGPGEMSLLSVSVQYYARPEIVAVVPRSCFWPEPGVDSAIIKLSLSGNSDNNLSENSPSNQIVKSKRFFDIVRLGFANRRKLLIKNLSSFSSRARLDEIFVKIGLKPTVRAQELSMEKWRDLANHLC